MALIERSNKNIAEFNAAMGETSELLVTVPNDAVVRAKEVENRKNEKKKPRTHANSRGVLTCFSDYEDEEIVEQATYAAKSIIYRARKIRNRPDLSKYFPVNSARPHGDAWWYVVVRMRESLTMYLQGFRTSKKFLKLTLCVLVN